MEGSELHAPTDLSPSKIQYLVNEARWAPDGRPCPDLDSNSSPSSP
jgi:hypothetical protein